MPDHDIRIGELKSGHTFTDIRSRPYTVDRLIAKGGMGAAYRVIDGSGRKQVLKVPINLSASYELFSEVRWTNGITDPRVAAVHGMAFLEMLGDRGIAIPCVLMNWYPKTLLEETLARKQIPAEEALVWIRDIAEALDLLQILHRDLKPENVFLGSNGRIAVGDFGLAVPVDRRLRDRAWVSSRFVRAGTLEYMSPEQFACLPDMDSRSDIYTMGLMLYEFVTGAPARTPLEEIENQRRREGARESANTYAIRYFMGSQWQVPTKLIDDVAVRSIVDRCIKLDREDRYVGHRDLVADINLALTGRRELLRKAR
jgi:serine/threonine protein kinase